MANRISNYFDEGSIDKKGKFQLSWKKKLDKIS